jgi:hypothetical protein
VRCDAFVRHLRRRGFDLDLVFHAGLAMAADGAEIQERTNVGGVQHKRAAGAGTCDALR